MIRFDRIIISGFKSAKSSVNVNFSSQNTSIIFGQNGSGKTSFLKILHAILVMDESVLIFNKVAKVEISYTNNDLSNHLTIKKNYETVKNNDEKFQYDWSELLSSSLRQASSLSLGVDRGVINQQAKVEPRVIYDFFRSPSGNKYSRSINLINLSEELSDHIRRHQTRFRNFKSSTSLEFEKKNLYLQTIKMDNIEELLIEKYRVARHTATKKIQSALFDTLSIAISFDNHEPTRKKDIPNNFNALVLEHAERIIEALDDGSDNKFKNRVIEILSNPELELELDKLRHHDILSQLFLNMINELKLEKQMLNAINSLTNAFNYFLINNKELIVKSDEVFIKVGSDQHSISELSSGERHMLTFLSLVLFEGGHRNFLIIDEPEISLNMLWQRELLSIFSKIIPETQIIVASHSPSLANHNPNYLCELEMRVG